ncbi:MAG: hypothetical protein RLZZ175_580 [Bacteroidota bacterium]|jgi:uncharacterized protein (TIGR01777 family)
MKTYNKIIIAGGNGFIGQELKKMFEPITEKIIILCRNPKNENEVFWDGKTIGHWANELENADLLLNLAGKSVNCRYTEENKKAILNSRVDTTNVLGEAIKLCKNAPKVWINSASATIYRHSVDKNMDEYNGEFHDDFSVQVCKKWEKTFNEFELPTTRKVILRMSIVLGKNGGALPAYYNLAKFGLGGIQGNGNQYFSWIHIQDLFNIIQFTLQNKDVNGVINCAAPNPLTNKEVMHIIRKKAGVPFGLPASKWMLEFGAFFLRTETELLLKSRKVVSKKLEELGFQFKFKTFKEAVDDLL